MSESTANDGPDANHGFRKNYDRSSIAQFEPTVHRNYTVPTNMKEMVTDQWLPPDIVKSPASLMGREIKPIQPQTNEKVLQQPRTQSIQPRLEESVAARRFVERNADICSWAEAVSEDQHAGDDEVQQHMIEHEWSLQPHEHHVDEKELLFRTADEESRYFPRPRSMETANPGTANEVESSYHADPAGEFTNILDTSNAAAIDYLRNVRDMDDASLDATAGSLTDEEPSIAGSESRVKPLASNNLDPTASRYIGLNEQADVNQASYVRLTPIIYKVVREEYLATLPSWTPAVNLPECFRKDAEPMLETYYGCVATKTDAVLLVEACRTGILLPVSPDLYFSAKSAARPGSVHVFRFDDFSQKGLLQQNDGTNYAGREYVDPDDELAIHPFFFRSSTHKKTLWDVQDPQGTRWIVEWHDLDAQVPQLNRPLSDSLFIPLLAPDPGTSTALCYHEISEQAGYGLERLHLSSVCHLPIHHTPALESMEPQTAPLHYYNPNHYTSGPRITDIKSLPDPTACHLTTSLQTLDTNQA
ncbi:uncharacterized protein BDV17DRAFT_146130 [Aspergillus undulatus]|uniref:uncharacterized protein n=1 Tax=Aspergillus undulatus TaxID=1810928 RepID=UPI003CCE04DA